MGQRRGQTDFESGRSLRLGHPVKNMIKQPIDVIVIGAGIIGAACAEALAARGLRVTVIEQETVGSGATAAGMGHLVVMDDNAAELALSAYSLRLWKELVGDHPQRHEYSRCGTIWVAADEDELVAAALKAATLSAHGLACELLDATALYAREPQLRPGLAGGLLVRGDGLVYPPTNARCATARCWSGSACAPSKTMECCSTTAAGCRQRMSCWRPARHRARCCRNCRCKRRRDTSSSPTVIPASSSTSWLNWATSRARMRPTAIRWPSMCSHGRPDKS